MILKRAYIRVGTNHNVEVVRNKAGLPRDKIVRAFNECCRSRGNFWLRETSRTPKYSEYLIQGSVEAWEEI